MSTNFSNNSIEDFGILSKLLQHTEGFACICDSNDKIIFANDKFIDYLKYNPTGKTAVNIKFNSSEQINFSLEEELFTGIFYVIEDKKRLILFTNTPTNSSPPVSRFKHEIISCSGLFDHFTDGIVLMDRNLIIQYANDAHTKILDLPKDKLINHSLTEFLDDHARFIFLENIEKIKKLKRFVYENVITKKDGYKKYLHVSSTGLFDENNEFNGLLNVVSDITHLKQAEKELLEYSNELQNLYDTAIDGIMVGDLETGKLLRCNKAVSKFLGYSEEELSQMYIFDLHSNEINEIIKNEQFKYLKEGKSVSIDKYPFLKKDGSTIYLQFDVNPIFFKEKLCGIAFIKDITLYTQIETALKDAQQAQQTLLDNIPDMAWLKDTRSRFLAINRAMEQGMNLKLDEIIGQDVYNFNSLEADREWREHDEIVMKSGKRHTFEERWINPEGKEYWFEVIKSPLYNSRGDLVGTTGIARNIDERRRLEKQLRLTQFFLDNAYFAAFLVNTEAKILYVNDSACKLTSYTKEELLNMHTYEMNTVYSQDVWVEHYAELEEKGSLTFETELIKKDKTLVPVQISSSFFKFEDQKFHCSLAIDITERKIYESELKIKDEEIKKTINELKESNKELEQFAYLASHDLQEPLRTLRSYVQLLEKEFHNKLDENAVLYIKFIVDSSNKMKVLIEDLLAYSRIGTKKIQFDSIDSNALLDQATGNLKMAIEETGAIITRENLPVIKVDIIQMIQLFQNLLSNAIKFHSKETPRIHISANKINSEWQFSIKDNGIGIAPIYHEKIYDIFHRLPTKQEYSGTGIGLSICKKILERHNGKIWVESEAGKGTTFYFTIPDIQ